MTDQEQDMTVATALGWKIEQINVHTKQVTRPDGGFWQVGNNIEDVLPRYGSDLNACHEMEKFLTGDQVRIYVDHLSFLNNAGNGSIRFHGRWACASATAPQRREAFLRTLDLHTD